MKRTPTTLFALSALVLLAGASALSAQQPLRVGEYVDAELGTDHPYRAPRSFAPSVVWSEIIHHPGATYVAPYFERFELADGDYLIVRSPAEEGRSRRYTGFGKKEYGREGGGGFWGARIPGDTAIVELWSAGSRGAWGVAIDRYARGFTEAEIAEWNRSPFEAGFDESICTADDKENAVCYEISEAEIYDKSRAVARLFIQNAFLCTGWLIGDEGHLMTNEHCITSQAQADNTEYEFLAEGETCETNCPQLGCDGIVEADQGTLVQDSVNLDYALVELPTNLTGTYGFLQLRADGAVLEERIYSPQHPGGRGKEIAVLSTYPENPSGFCEVDSLVEPVCSGGSALEVGYFADTEGGSSGSPVLAYADHLVVALHHCRGAGFCSSGGMNDDPNRGVPVAALIEDLGQNLPNNAIGGLFADGFESGDTSSWDSTVD